MKNDFMNKWKDNTPLLCCSRQLGLRSGNSIKGFLHNCVCPPSSLLTVLKEMEAIMRSTATSEATCLISK